MIRDPGDEQLHPAGDDADAHEPPLPRVAYVGGVLVVTPQGVLDDGTVDSLGALVRATDEPVVVDLRECVLGQLTVLGRLLPERLGRGVGDVCVACARTSGRVLLTRSRAAQVAVFATVADAVQARVLHEHGYGSGWEVP